MKAGKWLCFLGVAIFSWLSFQVMALAGDNEQDRNTLRGIKGFSVVVEDIRPEFEQAGLAKAQIQTDVELKLRLAGIKVLTKEESWEEPGTPMLYVCPQVTKSGKNYLYRVDVEFNQMALSKIDGRDIYGVTWSVGGLGLTVNLNDLRQVIKDAVDQFINAYLSVNPKK